MRLQRRRPAEPSSQRGDTVVVMDVLRMTTTASVLMSRPSCTSVGVAGTIEDLERLSLPISGCVVVSELVSASWQGAWVDNSPVAVARTAFGERAPMLVTTNGTRTLLSAAACGGDVLLASFRDLHAVARHIAERATPSVVLMPAGHFASGEGRVEDDLCADALESLLTGKEVDLEACAAFIRADPRVRRRVQDKPTFSADLDVALQADPGAAVLRFHPLGAGTGRIVRAGSSPALPSTPQIPVTGDA